MNQEQSTEILGEQVGDLLKLHSEMQKAPKPNLGALADFIYIEFETPTRRAAERIADLIVYNWDRIKGYME